MKILLRLQRFLERFGVRDRRYWIERVDDVPDKPAPHVLYAIGEAIPWQAALLCPCGCKHLIQLSLLRDDSPRWDLSGQVAGLATLHPSVWRTKDCMSHFILNQGRVSWCTKIRLVLTCRIWERDN
jgi:Family of unknown function (DUF6527)